MPPIFCANLTQEILSEGILSRNLRSKPEGVVTYVEWFSNGNFMPKFTVQNQSRVALVIPKLLFPST